MRFVDHDPAAATAATATCRDAAIELRSRAKRLTGPMGDHLGAWSGNRRLRFDAAAEDLADALLAEADALDGTADAIDAATERARRADAQRRAAHEREQRRLAEPDLPEGVR